MKSLILSFAVTLVLTAFFLFITGCSTSIIVKDCEPSESNKQICKTLKPWE